MVLSRSVYGIESQPQNPEFGSMIYLTLCLKIIDIEMFKLSIPCPIQCSGETFLDYS